MRTLPSLFLLLLLAGCSNGDAQYAGYVQRTGDLVPFALDHAIACGASPKATNGLPLIDAAWRFKADTQGVQIYAEGSHFKDIEMFLSKAFGEPDASKGSKPTVQPEKGPWKSFGAYSVRDIGAGIQYFGNDKQCGLIIIRSQGHPIAR